MVSVPVSAPRLRDVVSYTLFGKQRQLWNISINPCSGAFKETTCPIASGAFAFEITCSVTLPRLLPSGEFVDLQYYSFGDGRPAGCVLFNFTTVKSDAPGVKSDVPLVNIATARTAHLYSTPTITEEPSNQSHVWGASVGVAAWANAPPMVHPRTLNNFALAGSLCMPPAEFRIRDPRLSAACPHLEACPICRPLVATQCTPSVEAAMAPPTFWTLL